MQPVETGPLQAFSVADGREKGSCSESTYFPDSFLPFLPPFSLLFY